MTCLERAYLGEGLLSVEKTKFDASFRFLINFLKSALILVNKHKMTYVELLGER
jgi:hypothetical protein